MKTSLTLFFATVFVSISAFGQKNLQPAYYVTNNADTVTGFIDYKEWRKNPDNFDFTKSKGTTIQKLTVKDAIGFCVTGKELYRKFFVNISMNDQFVNEMTTNNPASRSDSVFLKVLYDGGHVKLFSYADNLKSRLYVSSEGEPSPLELKNTGYMVEGKIGSEKEFRAVLLKLATQFAPANSSLPEKINATDYYKNDILDIVYAIDGKSGNKTAVKENKEKKPAIRFWAGAGIGINPITISGDNHYAGLTSNAGVSPTFAAGFDFRFNPSIGKLFWRTEFAYTTAKTNAYTYEQLFELKDNYYLNLKLNDLAINETINYNFYNGESFKFFAGAGVGFNFSSYPVNRETHIREANTDTTTTVYDNYIAYTKNFWLNGMIRTGVALKNIEAAISYTTKGNFSNYGSFSTDVSFFRLQVNYLFGR